MHIVAQAPVSQSKKTEETHQLQLPDWTEFGCLGLPERTTRIGVFVVFYCLDPRQCIAPFLPRRMSSAVVSCCYRIAPFGHKKKSRFEHWQSVDLIYFSSAKLLHFMRIGFFSLYIKIYRMHFIIYLNLRL